MIRVTDKAAYDAASRACNASELLMLNALLQIQPKCMDEDRDGCLLTKHPHMRLYPQYRGPRVAPFVLDFALIVQMLGGIEIKMNIECDGHDFHNANPGRVERDHRRNRYLKNAGFLVERFTGTEIATSALLCAKVVEEAIDTEFAKIIHIASEHQWQSHIREAHHD